MRNRLIAAVFALSAFSLPALGQNTGGVFGPVVNEGHQSWQYRIALDSDTDRDAQRLHYQRSINDDFMWRVVVQRREMANGQHEHDYLQGELFWQLPDIRSNWHQGVRFDLLARDDGRPYVFGLHWMSDLHFDDRWMLRTLLLTGVQFGQNRESGLALQTRASLNYKALQGFNLALSMFNRYGFVDDMPGFEEQRHQIGPTLSASLGQGWSLQAGYLKGITRSTSDDTFRLWLTKAL